MTLDMIVWTDCVQLYEMKIKFGIDVRPQHGSLWYDMNLHFVRVICECTICPYLHNVGMGEDVYCWIRHQKNPVNEAN